MALTGYMKIEDIPGESKRADHVDEIDLSGLSWGASQTNTVVLGSGRSAGKASISSIAISKYYDAASPYLALACMQGKAFAEIIITARKDSGDVHLDYLTITIGGCMLDSYQVGASMDGEAMPTESISIAFDTIKIKYIQQADDHSAGDEHEIEYDVIAGV